MSLSGRSKRQLPPPLPHSPAGTATGIGTGILESRAGGVLFDKQARLGS